MSQGKANDAPRLKRSRFRAWIFPAGVAGVYLILYPIVPGRTLSGLGVAGQVLLQASLPLIISFGMMLLLNLFITPSHVSKLLGGGAGVKGIFLSAVAGILSMGPIFAWYPFLATLRKKGTSDFHLANFLSHRAVKPVLLPMMIVYFGWRFSLIFTIFCIFCALVTAAIVGMLGGQR